MCSVQNTTAHKNFCANERGSRVLVRVFGGQLVERRLWSTDSDVAFVCADDVFATLMSGQAGPPPTAFLLSDVIDPATGRDLANGG